MALQKPKGTNDIFGKESEKWNYIENLIRETCVTFGLSEIRTPIFEFKHLFCTGVGEGSDIVQKEMFTFRDRGERNYALKPEGTASTVRAFIEQKMYADPQPTKLFYITPSFRDERNQAGRFKQFHQFGVEVFGSYDASADAEVLSFVVELLNKLKIKDVTLKLNSLGGEECRKNYNLALKNYLNENIENFCIDCKSRFEKNPLRVLDCKNPKCQENLADVPIVIDFLEEDSKEHFENLKTYLEKMGINFEINPKIVRGLDYYTKTVFEFVCKSEKLGSQSTICGGGRYDNLISRFGGPANGAVGFAVGIERIIMLMEEQGIELPTKNQMEIYIGSIGEAGFTKAQEIAYSLRKDGIKCEYDIVKRSVKSQLKYADKIGAKFVIIIGDNEIENNIVSLKDMACGQQVEVKLSEIKEEIIKRR